MKYFTFILLFLSSLQAQAQLDPFIFNSNFFGIADDQNEIVRFISRNDCIKVFPIEKRIIFNEEEVIYNKLNYGLIDRVWVIKLENGTEVVTIELSQAGVPLSITRAAYADIVYYKKI